MLDFLFGESTGDISGRLSPVFQQYGAEAQFKPYTVTTGVGTTAYDPTTGTTRSALIPGAEELRNLAGSASGGMFGLYKALDLKHVQGKYSVSKRHYYNQSLLVKHNN